MSAAETLAAVLARMGTPNPERAANLMIGVAAAMRPDQAEAAAANAQQLLSVALQRPGLVRGLIRELGQDSAGRRMTIVRQLAEAGAGEDMIVFLLS